MHTTTCRLLLLSSLRFDQRSCLAFLMELASPRLFPLGCVSNTLALCCRIVEAFSVTAADIPTLRGFDVGANRKFPAPSPFEASVEYVEDMAMRFMDGGECSNDLLSQLDSQPC